MGWLPRVCCVLALAGCGPQVGVPGDDEGGGGSSGGPPPPSTTTGGTMPTPVTTGMTTVSTSIDDSTSGEIFPRDWGLQPGTTGGCPEWAFMGCGETPRTNAFVGGSTPLGEFDVTYAAFAGDAGCSSCVETPNVDRVVLVSTPADVPGFEPDDGLVLELSAFEGPADETIDGIVVAIRDGMSVSTSAIIELESLPGVTDLADPFDPLAPAIVNGNFAAKATDWSLTGTFSAVYCPRLNNFAICE